MTDKDSSPHIAALQELEAALDAHRRTQAEAGARRAPVLPNDRRVAPGSLARGGFASPAGGCRSIPGSCSTAGIRWCARPRSPAGAVVAVVLIGGGALWWRLSSGPIMLDLATPWLTSAIEQNLGSRYRVEVGGTQLERDAQGRTALRLRDIVLRDTSGVTVAVAPKAEVGISGTSLLIASPRAESFRLVDANMTIRIDPDGRVNVMVGGERPFVTIAPEARRRNRTRRQRPRPRRQRARRDRRSRIKSPQDNARVFSLQAMSRTQRRHQCRRLARLDRRTRQAGARCRHRRLRRPGAERDRHHQWKPHHRRPPRRLRVETHADQPEPEPAEGRRRGAHRSVGEPGAAMGGERRAVAGASGPPAAAVRSAQGRSRRSAGACAWPNPGFAPTRWCRPRSIPTSRPTARRRRCRARSIAEGGSIGNPDEPEHQIPISSAEFGLDWDAARRTLRVPFKVTAGAARYTLACRVRGARAARRQLAVRARRRLGRARSADAPMTKGWCSSAW